MLLPRAVDRRRTGEHLGQRWFFESALRLEQHLAAWTLRDLESGATWAIDDYTVRGLHLALGVALGVSF